MLNPLQYSIYKGVGGNNGAIQFNLQKPHFYSGKMKDYTGAEAFEVVDGRKRLKDGWKEREGAVFLEITSAKGKNVYDWENKIILALSVDDIGKVLETLYTGKECKIMHDPGAKTQSAGAVKKFLNVTSPNGTAQGCIFQVAKSVGTDTVRHKVPVGPNELIVLRALLTSAISKALNW
jgi:hypothetical protein